MRATLLALLFVVTGCAKKEGADGGGGESVKYTQLSVDELAAEWKPNPVAAAAKYKSGGVELTGRLHKIDSWFGADSLIELRGADGAPEKGAQIVVKSQAAKDGLAKCAVGKSVVVKARSDGSTNERPWLVADEIRPAN